jgi:hypothetical protein
MPIVAQTVCGLAAQPGLPIVGFMDEPHPAKELATLRDLVRRLESGDLSARLRGVDVTKQEIGLLRREIARLDMILNRLAEKLHDRRRRASEVADLKWQQVDFGKGAA